MTVTKEGVTAVLLALALAGAQAFAAPVELPAPSTGVIDGKVALLFWPVKEEGNVPLPAGGCEVHLVPDDAMTTEHLYPCSAWFQPPKPGRYLIWLEQGASVSMQTFLMFDYLPFRGTGYTVLMPMKPAGSLRIDPQPAAGSNATLRVLSLDESFASPRAFDRSLTPARAAAPVRVPVGPAIAGVFNASGEARSLSLPVKVTAGGSATAKPRPPEKGTDVLVSLVRRGRFEGAGCSSTVTVSGHPPQPADAFLEAADRIVAVWYGVEGDRASVLIQCAASQFDRAFDLPKKSVVTIRDYIR